MEDQSKLIFLIDKEMVGLLLPVLQFGQRTPHKFFIILQLLSFLEGHVDDLLFVIHDFLPLDKLGPHFKHLRMQAEIREAIAIVLLEVTLEIFLHVLVLDLCVPHLVLYFLQMIGEVLVVLLHLFYFDGQSTK